MSYWKAGTTFVFTNDVYIKIKKIECTANERHIENVTCTLKPLNWTRSVLNMDCDIIGSLENVSVSL
ncbi:uncharacterized protein Dwil_GK20848 [Drosophila willistoni]|uniref:Uncharacterized protein n=1 Tax=Drosophila willistoni TaxID=7260 RepID=A0A0Q9WVX0_DROWI|nr:uncharacterized protein Dwil_GK20848 [Drosophila willistoni]